MSATCDASTALARPAHRRRSLAGLALVLSAVTGLTACGEQSSDSAPAATAAGAAQEAEDATTPGFSRLAAGADKPELTCESDERAGMIADHAQDAKGATTPEKALAEEELEEDEAVVVSASGRQAWVLRADGTARAEIRLREAGGWVVEQRTACG